eukprot:TRINITY_DN92795_c0_g1_i1.p1 TRINITY_DN92795_c0_g1~~TRINITY_DN92795_c0_g1_i1.p1  ORF type:complete len:517 (+),score=55.49 TRINITY_DN92795_c0_g1_i1:46-1551(+)
MTRPAEWRRCRGSSRQALLALLVASWGRSQYSVHGKLPATFCLQSKVCRQNWTPFAGSHAFGSQRQCGNLQRPAGPSQPAEQVSDIKLSSPVKSGLNLLKSLLGSGNLALPSAVAAFSASGKAIVPAVAIALLFSLVSAYAFVLITRICEATQANSYQDAWSKTISPGFSWMPAMAVLMKTWFACVSYLMIIGDCTSKVLLPIGVPALVAGRNSVIIAVAIFVLLPLCSLKSMAPLAKLSVVGILSSFYCLFVIAFRCISGSYASGALLAAAPAVPKFTAFTGNAFTTALTPASTVLIATLAYAYTNHYSAPQFYSELEPGPDGSRTTRMRKVAYTAFLGGWAFFSAVMAFGFLTFGASSQGMILNSYALTDQLAVLARLALSISMLASFPIIFASFRSGLISAVGAPAVKFQDSKPLTLTAFLLLTIVPSALILRDLGVLAAFSGAVLACFVCYIAPALMAIRARRRGLLRSDRFEKALNFVLVPTGFVLGVLGAVQTLR